MFIETLVCDLIDTFFLDYYLSCYFKRKRDKWFIAGIIVIMIVAVLVKTYLKRGALTMLLPAVSFMLFFVYCNTFFEGKKFMKAVMIGVFYGLCNVADCVVYGGTIILNIDQSLFNANRGARIILLLILQGLMFLMIMSFMMFSRRITVKVPNIYLFLVSLFFISFVAMYGIQYSFFVTDNINVRKIYLGVLLIVLLFILVFSIKVVSMQIKEKEREKFLKKEWDIQNEFLSKAVKQYNNLRVLRHDYNNHISTMQALYSNGDKDELGKYVSEYKDELKYSFRTDICSDAVVSAIIQDKTDEALLLDKSIKFECDENIEFKKNQREFCCCLVNLIDMGMKKSRAYVDVKINKRGNCLCLRVKCELEEKDNEENIIKIVKKLTENEGCIYNDMSTKEYMDIEAKVEVI